MEAIVTVKPSNNRTGFLTFVERLALLRGIIIGKVISLSLTVLESPCSEIHCS